MNKLQENLNEILRQKEEYLVPENIKKDITVLGVTGALESGESFDVDLPERIDCELGRPGGLKIPLPRDMDFSGCTAITTFLGKEKQMEYWNTNYLGQVSNTYIRWDSVEQRYNLEIYFSVWNKDTELFDYGLRVNILKNGVYSQNDIVLDLIIPDFVYVEVGFLNASGSSLNIIQEQNVTMVYEDGTAVPFEKLTGYYTDTFLVKAKHDVNVTIDIDGNIYTAQLNNIEEAIARGDTSLYMSIRLNISIFTANLFLVRDNGTFRQAYDFAETTLDFYDANDNILKTVVSTSYSINNVTCMNATRCEATIRSFEFITPHKVSLPNGVMAEYMIVPDARPNQRVYMICLKYVTESGEFVPVPNITNYSGTISNSVTPEETPIELQCIGATIGCVTDVTEDVSWEVLHATIDDPRYAKAEPFVSTSETETITRNIIGLELRKEEPLDPAYAYKTVRLMVGDSNVIYDFVSDVTYNPNVDLQAKMDDFATRHTLEPVWHVNVYDKENDVLYRYRTIEPNMAYIYFNGDYYYGMNTMYRWDPTDDDEERSLYVETLDFKNDIYISAKQIEQLADVKSFDNNGTINYLVVFPESLIPDGRANTIASKDTVFRIPTTLMYIDGKYTLKTSLSEVVPIEKLNP